MLQNLLTWWPAQAAQYLICVLVLILDCASQDASKHHCIQPHQILFVCLHVLGFPPQVSSLSSVTYVGGGQNKEQHVSDGPVIRRQEILKGRFLGLLVVTITDIIYAR